MSPPLTSTLADVTSGFRDVVHGAQQTYRVLLAAMSRPGSVLRLPDAAIEGIVPPASLGLGMTAILLALLDGETTTVLRGRARSAAAETYLRFHTGARLVDGCDGAGFAVACADELDEATWRHLGTGTDEAPQAGATLLVEAAGLGADARADDRAVQLALRGPGIESRTEVFVAGPPRGLWQWRIDLERRMPRGVDLILVCGDRLVALPRSTRVVVIEGSR